jgi:hypothetical protein
VLKVHCQNSLDLLKSYAHYANLCPETARNWDRAS